MARYFCFVNSTTKEIIDINESAAKKINTTVEDHHFLNDYFQLLYPGLLLNNIAFGLYVAMRPSSHADDIETPPPNVAFV